MNRREQKELARTGEEIVKLHVLGAAGGVTGSLNLVEVFRRDKTFRFLLDVGLHLEEAKADFQNRLPKGLKASDIDMAVISHAHIDHSGYLPKLIKNGFKGPVYVTPATQDLLGILLPDSGYLQEEEAKRRNKRRAKQLEAEADQPAKPGKRPKKAAVQPEAPAPQFTALYTEAEARASLAYLKPLEYNVRHELLEDIAVTFTDAGHILGSAVVNVEIGRGSRKRTLCFSGNIGRYNMPVLQDMKQIAGADYLIVESTYGNRLHKVRDRQAHMAEVIKGAYERALEKDGKEGCGVILIPAFAVGRAQVVLDDLRQLMESGAIPSIPVYLDGRMSASATEIHRKHANLLNAETRAVFAAGKDPFKTPRYSVCKDWQDSAKLQEAQNEPIIIVGSSGMANGGRIVSHLAKRLSGRNNTVLFVGYQGTGTLGHSLVRFAQGGPVEESKPTKGDAPKTVNVQGKTIKVRATVEFMSDFSAHADYSDTIRWMKGFRRKPKLTLAVHGDTDALAGLQKHVSDALKWEVVVPKPREVFDLS